MAKTSFVDLVTPIAAAFLNKIFSHVHDGADEDGSAPKINLVSHVQRTEAMARNAAKVVGFFQFFADPTTGGSGSGVNIEDEDRTGVGVVRFTVLKNSWFGNTFVSNGAITISKFDMVLIQVFTNSATATTETYTITEDTDRYYIDVAVEDGSGAFEEGLMVVKIAVFGVND
jgi:hypothetical protein